MPATESEDLVSVSKLVSKIQTAISPRSWE